MKNIYLLFLVFRLTNCYSQGDLIVKELHPDSFNLDFQIYDQSTALFCGQLSEVAYWKRAKIENLYHKVNVAYPERSLNYKFIEHEKTHAQALLWCNKDFLVVSFRGTEPSKFRDWFTDAKFWNYQNNPSQNDRLKNMPPGHGGFRKSLIGLIQDENLLREIVSIIEKTNSVADTTTFPIYLTGHSLGSSLSQLFMECLTFQEKNFSGAYHFAPPLAVSCSINGIMKERYGKRVYDIINYKDYIPRAGRIDVAHFGKFYRICDNGLMYRTPDAYVKFSKLEYFKVVKYHKLENHLLAIRNMDNTSDSISNRSIEGKFPCLGDSIEELDPCKKSD